MCDYSNEIFKLPRPTVLITAVNHLVLGISGFKLKVVFLLKYNWYKNAELFCNNLSYIFVLRLLVQPLTTVTTVNYYLL